MLTANNLFRAKAISVAVTSAIANPCLGAKAEVDPKIYSLCIEAKDYKGCIQAMRGDSLQPRLTVDEGKAEIIGFNSCPAGYRYKGNGFCGEGKSKTRSHRLSSSKTSFHQTKHKIKSTG